MNHKGYRSQAGNHSCKERHTCPLTDLFAEYGKEEGCHSFEIRFVWKKRAVAKEFIPFHNDHSPVKAAKCAENGSDSSARDAQRRERAHAKDEQKIHNDIYDVSKDIAFHNSRRMPEAELDGLEQGGHRRDKNGNNGYLPIGQRLRHVFRFRAHKKEYVFQIKIENTVNWQKTAEPMKSDFFKRPAAVFLSPRPASRETKSVTADARERLKQRTISRGWIKILTAAMETAPNVPTMIRSAEARRIMKRPSKAAGNAMLKYFLSYESIMTIPIFCNHQHTASRSRLV